MQVAVSSSAVPVVRRAIIGRGCDPVRAKHAEELFSKALGVDVDSATSDEELWAKMSKRSYEVLFMAPGLCQLTRAGRYSGSDMAARARELQPGIKVVAVEDVSTGLSVLGQALGLSTPVQNLAKMSEAWPFVD